jgi:hypothetical protein
MTTVCETRSFHTRLRLTPKQDAALRDACRVFGDVTRAVYQELSRLWNGSVQQGRPRH